MDAAGRSVDIDVLNYDDNDQDQLDLFRERMRNMSSQEREILIIQ
jgi:7,8-dihydro-6-hydroxymethylpterin-pyrophosphokinase